MSDSAVAFVLHREGVREMQLMPPCSINRDFRFAFRLQTNVPPFASAPDLSCVCFHPKAPGHARLDRLRDQNAMFFPISKRFLGHLPVNSPPSYRLVSPSCRG
jgi:hypothetical protein